jgi:Rho-binding antiterminator
MNKPYQPISCALYSQFELSILRGERLRLAWRRGGGLTCMETVRPLDLRTRRHAEYLILRRSDGRRRFLRLDRIVQAEALGGLHA